MDKPWEPEVMLPGKRQLPDAVIIVRKGTGERVRYVPERKDEPWQTNHTKQPSDSQTS